MNRREILKLLLSASGGLLSVKLAGSSRIPERFPVRSITSYPRFHWFGYYDKLQFDPLIMSQVARLKYIANVSYSKGESL